MTHNPLFSLVNEMVILFPCLLLIFTFNGFFKTLTAKIMGDTTAYNLGFLTFNPLAHIDLLGLFIILITYLLIGILFGEPFSKEMFCVIILAFGSHMIIQPPINDAHFKYIRLGGLLTIFSGTFGNFLLAFLSALCLKGVILLNLPYAVTLSFVMLFKTIINIAILFGILNLIPLPPFTGGHMLYYIVPTAYHRIIHQLEHYSLFIFFALFFLPGISETFFAFLSLCTMIIKKMLLGFVL
ncbi:MAG: Peptidase M50 [candidate division TM6 bacterium GW2011_GWF2_38_10]|nr:MAG: Peptidase M50 [candidate division TM6 bacterium GW2011_GWF2_38_10]